MEKQKLGPFQKAWLYDLRKMPKGSQGRNYLVSGGSQAERYCCLGVAEAITFGNTPVCGSNGKFYFPDIILGDITYKQALALTNATMKKLKTYSDCARHRDYGIDNDNEDFEGDKYVTRSLTAMNDGGWTFEQIADQIELDPGAYFSEPA